MSELLGEGEEGGSDREQKKPNHKETAPPHSNPLTRLSVDSRGVEREGVNIELEEDRSKEKAKHRAKSNHAVDHTDAEGRCISKGKGSMCNCIVTDHIFLRTYLSTWLSMYAVPNVKRGDPPIPRSSWDKVKKKTGRVGAV